MFLIKINSFRFLDMYRRDKNLYKITFFSIKDKMFNNYYEFDYMCDKEFVDKFIKYIHVKENKYLIFLIDTFDDQFYSLLKMTSNNIIDTFKLYLNIEKLDRLIKE